MASWVARKVKRDFKLRRRSNTVGINLQEIYLRDDIPCGSAACRKCIQSSPRLPTDVSHYLIPDANALLKFWEVLDLPQVTAVIYLASVVREVQLRSNQRNWRRLRLLFSDKRRHSFYYDDEHSIYTWLLCNESSKGIECIAGWLYEHLEGAMPIIVMTGTAFSSVDPKGYELAKDFEKRLSFGPLSSNHEAIMVLNAADYFSNFWSHDASVTELCSALIQSQIDMTISSEDTIIDEHSGATSHKNFIYKEHLSANAIEEGTANGDLRIGIFHVRKYTPNEGFVRPSNKGEASLLEILVPGRKLQNRALHGDLVAVHVFLSGNAEKQKSVEVNDDSIVGETVNLVQNGSSHHSVHESRNLIGDDEEEHENHSVATKRGVIKGEVVGIIQRAQRDYVACLDETEEVAVSLFNSRRQEQLLCVPMDQRIPLVRVASRQRSQLLGQRFVIRIDGWDSRSKLPRGHVARILGPIGEINAENMAVLVENDINISPFSSASLQELPEDTEKHPWVIPEEEYSKRRDLRFLHRACSIDPPGSKDVDDVLSICELPDNFLEVGVHIADVSYFVKEDSLLDLEARSRGTTVYLVGSTYHMLPPILSENLCSLREGKDRLAVSVIWTVDPDNDFEVLSVWSGRTIIRSRHQMSYAQAQAILDGQPLCEGWEIDGGPGHLAQLQADLRNLATFAQIRQTYRESQGALELSSTELSFDIDDGGEAVHVKTKLDLPMNWIVAEMMIFANSCAAQQIYESFPYAALLRRHRPPNLDNFRLLLEICEARGFILDISNNKALAASLHRMRDSNDPTIESAFKALTTRAMAEAEYVSTGEVPESSAFYHYGLALEFYTHFTSPIRRYADIIVHRMLVVSCSSTTFGQESKSKSNVSFEKFGQNLTSTDDLKQLADHLNQRHRASKRAQKQCSELHLLMYLQKHAEAQYALVLEILEKGLVVFVPKYDLRGFVNLQGKNGNVILPLDKDETACDTYSNDMNGSQFQKYKLRHESQGISILDSFGNILHEYRQMSPVWVQLRADGSRARTPTLRIQVLSESHPASLAAQKEHASLATASKQKGSLLPSILSKDQTTVKSERRKAIHKMAELAAEEKFGRTKGKINEPDKKATIHEAMEDVERMINEATSVYASLEDEEMEKRYRVMLPTPEVSKVELNNELIGRLSLINVALENSCIEAEDEIKTYIRQLWQKRLCQAAELRSRHSRSPADDQEEKQKRRFVREQKTRQRAEQIGQYVGLLRC